MWQTNSSYLKLYIGCMFASKSSHLMSEVNRFRQLTDKILVVNSTLDIQRHSDLIIDSEGIGAIKSHDSKQVPAIMLKRLSDLKTNSLFKNKYKYADVVVIDEGQFFDDLHDFIRENLTCSSFKKTFIVAGLSSDYNMQPIGDIIKLVPMADEIIKLTAYCVYCKDGTAASFTKKETGHSHNSNILVGAKDLYSPVCRKHFLDEE